MEEHIKVANKMIRFITKDFSPYHKKKFKQSFIGIYNIAKRRSYGGLTRNSAGRQVPYITIAKRSMYDVTSLKAHLEKHKLMRNFENIKQSWQGLYASGFFGRWMFVEYASFHMSHTIGGFYSDDYKLHRDATIAHEIGHAVQHYCDLHEYHKFGKDYKSHGGVWKEAYSQLREKYINPHVQPIGKTELNNYITEYTKIWKIEHPPKLQTRLKTDMVDLIF